LGHSGSTPWMPSREVYRRKKHAGSLEALWVTRPEAVDLGSIKLASLRKIADNSARIAR
jgi:hypothetical protein